MPRVSDQHLEARRAQIVEAAVRCFARQGFHATSMQDVFAESGLSAGAVYRYFPSKSALVRATSEYLLGRLGGILGAITGDGAPATPAALVEYAGHQAPTIRAGGEVPVMRLALNAWSEALRDPDVAVVVSTVIREVRGHLRDMAEQWQRDGRLSSEADPALVAQAVYSLLIGYLVQSMLTADDVDPDSFAQGVRWMSAVTDPEVAGSNA